MEILLLFGTIFFRAEHDASLFNLRLKFQIEDDYGSPLDLQKEQTQMNGNWSRHEILQRCSF